jgi:hypothetical protein
VLSLPKGVSVPQGPDLELSSGFGEFLCYRKSGNWHLIVTRTAMSVFDEKYRVVAVEGDRLLLRGVLSGDVLTILNSEPEIPLTLEEYPVGKLISLTDPSSAPLN